MTPLDKIAKRISAHLQRFEKDPAINTVGHSNIHKFFRAGSWHAGRFVHVQYISFQGSTHLTKAEAETYLAWLDAGNIGTHRQSLKEK